MNWLKDALNPLSDKNIAKDEQRLFQLKSQAIRQEAILAYKTGDVERACLTFNEKVPAFVKEYDLDKGQIRPILIDKSYSQAFGPINFKPLPHLAISALSDFGLNAEYFSSNAERATVLESLVQAGVRLDNYNYYQCYWAERGSYTLPGVPVLKLMAENFSNTREHDSFAVYFEAVAKQDGLDQTCKTMEKLGVPGYMGNRHDKKIDSNLIYMSFLRDTAKKLLPH